MNTKPDVTADEVLAWFNESGGQERHRPRPSRQDCQIIADNINIALGDLSPDNNWVNYKSRMAEVRKHAGSLLISMAAAEQVWTKLKEPHRDLPGAFKELQNTLAVYYEYSAIHGPDDDLRNQDEFLFTKLIVDSLRNAGWKKVSLTSNTSIALRVFVKCMARIYGENGPKAQTLARKRRTQKANKTRQKNSD